MHASMTGALRKICATCGRQISWRKKWEKNWNSIIYCSDSCRKHKIRPNSLDTSFESKILSLLAERKAVFGSAAVVTCEEAEDEFCKAEAGSSGLKEEGPDARGNQEKVRHPRARERCRQAARRLAAKGEILVTQGGQVVDPSFAKGVMELRLPQ